jgi:hypothetical protein
MASADQIGRGILLNVSGVTAEQTSAVFMDSKRANATVVCCHSTAASEASDSTGTGLIIEVEDPTTENQSTFTAFTLSTQDVAANTVRKVIIEGASGSRVRCRITPNSSSAIKIWAWSVD